MPCSTLICFDSNDWFIAKENKILQRKKNQKIEKWLTVAIPVLCVSHRTDNWSSNYVHTKCFLFSEYIKFFKSRKSNYKGVGLNFILIGVCLRDPTWVSDPLSLRGRKLSTNKCHLNMTSTLAVAIQAPITNKLGIFLLE